MEKCELGRAWSLYNKILVVARGGGAIMALYGQTTLLDAKIGALKKHGRSSTKRMSRQRNSVALVSFPLKKVCRSNDTH